jgi:hypothetical protein
MTSLTDQFLSRLREAVRPKSESPTPQETSPPPSGETSSDASSDEPTPEKNMLKTTFKGKRADLAEATGVIAGLIVGGIVTLLLGGWSIHWILTSIGIGNFTYGQVVGLLAIWEIIKPRLESK